MADNEEMIQDEAVESTEQVEEFDREALEEKVSASMAGVFSEEDETAAEESVEETNEELETDEAAAEDEETPPDDSDEGGDEVEEEIAREAAADDDTSDAPILPDSYRRTLEAYQWTPDEIDEALQVQGAKFVETAGRIHANRNKELQQWAAIGRQARQTDQSQQGDDPAAPPAQSQAPTQGVPSPLAPIDVAALKEKYGEDELLNEVIGPVNGTINAINALLPQLEQGVTRAAQNERDALAAQVEAFFDHETMESYRELYGTTENGGQITEEQWGQRNKVLEMADALATGAKVQGRELTVQEALSLAHDSVSIDHTQTAVRNTIKKQVKQRNRSITNKPSNRGRSTVQSSKGAPKSRAELEQRTKDRMATVFG